MHGLTNAMFMIKSPLFVCTNNTNAFRCRNMLYINNKRCPNTEVIVRLIIHPSKSRNVGSQWPPILRRRSAAARLLKLWVRIPPGGGGYLSVVIVVCCQVRGVCDELISRPEESFRLWCLIVCDVETS